MRLQLYLQLNHGRPPRGTFFTAPVALHQGLFTAQTAFPLQGSAESQSPSTQGTFTYTGSEGS